MSRPILNRADWLFRATKNPAARWAIQNIGYPIPQQLDRGLEDGKPRLLANFGHNLAQKTIGVVAAAGNMKDTVKQQLESCGAVVAKSIDDTKLDGLVIDASALTPASADPLWSISKSSLPAVKRGGRVAVISTSGTIAGEGCYGFVKSAAKELGGRGITVNLLSLSPEFGLGTSQAGVVTGLTSPLSFLLSSDAAFVSGQRLCPQPIPLTKRVSTGVDTLALAGKIAVVTGGSRGIGEAIVRRLASEGAYVIIVDAPKGDESSVAALKQLATQVNGVAYPGNVTSPMFPAEFANYLLKTYGGVDIVVHNAGITADKTLAKMSSEQIQSVLDVNLRAIMRINGELGIVSPGVDVLTPQRTPVIRNNGRVVLLSSINGIAGAFGQTNYAFTKAALIKYASLLSQSSQLQSMSVGVSAIAPGFIETQMTAKIPPMGREIGRRLNCLFQGGLPHDIAAATAFLASPGGLGMSGQTLRVCGGHLAGQ